MSGERSVWGGGGASVGHSVSEASVVSIVGVSVAPHL